VLGSAPQACFSSSAATAYRNALGYLPHPPCDPAEAMPAGVAVAATFHTRLAMGAHDVLPEGSIEIPWTTALDNEEGFVSPPVTQEKTVQSK
jgi:hypothetical protein